MLRQSRFASIAVLSLCGHASAQQSILPCAQAILEARVDAEANRIVGLYSSRIDIGPCAGGPRSQVRGLNQFHNGGTLTETGSPPPFSRGPGLGVWRYNRATQSYEARMDFARFLPDGSFDGFSDVQREIVLNPDGSGFQDTIRARLLNPDDSLRMKLCGTAVAQRVQVR